VLGAGTDAELGFYVIRSRESCDAGARLGRSPAAFLPYGGGASRSTYDSRIAVSTAAAGDAMRRRQFGALAGAVFTIGVLGSPSTVALDRLVAAVLSGAEPARDAAPEQSLQQMRVAVVRTRAAYQAGEYPKVMADLPLLLAGLGRFPGSPEVDALLASAYHIVASVMLKLGDVPMATLAADRSFAAANRSGDPVEITGSRRIVVHALMSSGHATQAYHMAIEAADDRTTSKQSSPALTSVQGALILRAAVAAARAEDRGTALGLLDLAEAMAKPFHGRSNLRQTGFNNTNVQLHRVNIALALGDAGTAIDVAKTIDMSTVDLNERKATLLLDVAHAYAQWGKWEHALSAVLDAERVAPHEVRTRPSSAHLVATIAQHSEPSARHSITDLLSRMAPAR
jgi:hypothetical protein